VQFHAHICQIKKRKIARNNGRRRRSESFPSRNEINTTKRVKKTRLRTRRKRKKEKERRRRGGRCRRCEIKNRTTDRNNGRRRRNESVFLSLFLQFRSFSAPFSPLSLHLPTTFLLLLLLSLICATNHTTLVYRSYFPSTSSWHDSLSQATFLPFPSSLFSLLLLLLEKSKEEEREREKKNKKLEMESIVFFLERRRGEKEPLCSDMPHISVVVLPLLLLSLPETER